MQGRGAPASYAGRWKVARTRSLVKPARAVLVALTEVELEGPDGSGDGDGDGVVRARVVDDEERRRGRGGSDLDVGDDVGRVGVEMVVERDADEGRSEPGDPEPRIGDVVLSKSHGAISFTCASSCEACEAPARERPRRARRIRREAVRRCSCDLFERVLHASSCANGSNLFDPLIFVRLAKQTTGASVLGSLSLVVRHLFLF